MNFSHFINLILFFQLSINNMPTCFSRHLLPSSVLTDKLMINLPTRRNCVKMDFISLTKEKGKTFDYCLIDGAKLIAHHNILTIDKLLDDRQIMFYFFILVLGSS